MGLGLARGVSLADGGVDRVKGAERVDGRDDVSLRVVRSEVFGAQRHGTSRALARVHALPLQARQNAFPAEGVPARRRRGLREHLAANLATRRVDERAHRLLPGLILVEVFHRSRLCHRRSHGRALPTSRHPRQTRRWTLAPVRDALAVSGVQIPRTRSRGAHTSTDRRPSAERAENTVGESLSASVRVDRDIHLQQRHATFLRRV